MRTEREAMYTVQLLRVSGSACADFDLPPEAEVPHLEGQGDLVSRVTIWVLGLINLLTKSPLPSKQVSDCRVGGILGSGLRGVGGIQGLGFWGVGGIQGFLRVGGV